MKINKNININRRITKVPFKSVTTNKYVHSPQTIHMTGIRDFLVLKEIKKKIRQDYSCKIIKCKIDAIMLNRTSTVHQKINLNKLEKICNSIPNQIYDYNSELFNGSFLKSKTKGGTINFFSTGSVQAMGVTSLKNKNQIVKLVKLIFEKYDNMYRPNEE